MRELHRAIHGRLTHDERGRKLKGNVQLAVRSDGSRRIVQGWGQAGLREAGGRNGKAYKPRGKRAKAAAEKQLRPRGVKVPAGVTTYWVPSEHPELGTVRYVPAEERFEQVIDGGRVRVLTVALVDDELEAFVDDPAGYIMALADRLGIDPADLDAQWRLATTAGVVGQDPNTGLSPAATAEMLAQEVGELADRYGVSAESPGGHGMALWAASIQVTIVEA